MAGMCGQLVPHWSEMSSWGDRLMHTKNLARAVLAALAVLVMAFSPVAAVTDGWADETDSYDFVGLMVAFVDGEPAWRCSGTLISPTVYLTAGHCTDGAEWVEIWFDWDVTDRDLHDYPYNGDVGGTPYTYPGYDELPWYMADAGIVVLEEPYYPVSDVYGELPAPGQLNELATRRGKQNTSFVAVGYGLQKSFPDAAAWKESALRIRMIAEPSLIQINGGIVGDYSLLLTNNAHTGGTCFGDSGGPNFISGTYTIAGVTSFGMNGNCAGTGGVFRIDDEDVLKWIVSYRGY